MNQPKPSDRQANVRKKEPAGSMAAAQQGKEAKGENGACHGVENRSWVAMAMGCRIGFDDRNGPGTKRSFGSSQKSGTGTQGAQVKVSRLFKVPEERKGTKGSGHRQGGSAACHTAHGRHGNYWRCSSFGVSAGGLMEDSREGRPRSQGLR